ncbi:MAG TPA: hypothetical protein VJ044_14415 [Candidatus Hodarchaeales archaeon]|nr:hypothetical protein [Candidatus Hodarchaeales archaeon]
MQPVVIRDAYVAFQELSGLRTKRFKVSLRLADDGITFNSKLHQWSSIKDVVFKDLLGNPYVFLTFENDLFLSFWFKSGWQKLRKAPWHGTSEFYTRKFVEMIAEGASSPDLMAKLDAVISSAPELKITARLMQVLHNLYYFLVPTASVLLILLFISYILSNPEGISEL